MTNSEYESPYEGARAATTQPRATPIASDQVQEPVVDLPIPLDSHSSPLFPPSETTPFVCDMDGGEEVRERERERDEKDSSIGATGGTDTRNTFITLTTTQFQQMLRTAKSSSPSRDSGVDKEREYNRVVKNIASFTEGGNLTKYIAGLETQLIHV